MPYELLPWAVTAFAAWCAVGVARTGVQVARELFSLGPAPRRVETAIPVVTETSAPRQRDLTPLRQAA